MGEVLDHGRVDGQGPFGLGDQVLLAGVAALLELRYGLVEEPEVFVVLACNSWFSPLPDPLR